MSAGSRRAQQHTSSREVRAPEKQAGTVPDNFTAHFTRTPEGWLAHAPDAGLTVGDASLLEAFAGLATALAAQQSNAPEDTRRECTCLGSCRGAAGLGAGWKCALEPSPTVERREWSTHEAPTYSVVDDARNAGAL